MTGADDLHIGLVGGAIVSQQEGEAGHALETRRPRLDFAAAPVARDDRKHALVGETGAIDPLLASLQIVVDAQINRLQPWFQQLQVFRVQGEQEVVPDFSHPGIPPALLAIKVGI